VSRSSGGRRAVALVVAAPAVIAALVYAQTLGHGAVYDDPAALEMARQPIFELLTHRFGLTYLSIRLVQAACGSMPCHHLTNIVLHALCSALAGLLALNLTGRPWVALLTGALFAVHPVHVEVVASIENRKDMLAMLLGGASVLLYRSRAAWGYAGSLAALVLALSAKDAAAIGIAGVLPLAGLLPRPDGDVPWSERVAMTVRRLAPLIVVGVLTTAWYGGDLAGKFRSESIAFTTGKACSAYGEVLGTSAAAVPEVARLLVFPARLSADYPTRPQPGLTTAPALAGVAIVVAAGAAALWLASRAPVAAFAIAWTMITYLPVSNVVPLTAYFVAERYLYVPSFGICLLAALALDALGRRRALALAAAAAILLAGAIRSRVRVRDWQDDVTLWTAALRIFPQGSARIHAELGRALSEDGRTDEALPHLEVALALEPTRPEAHSHLGFALLNGGRAREALPHFRRALELWPENPLIRHNLAMALLEAGEREEAIRELRIVASEEAWRDLPAAVLAAVTRRGMTPETFKARVREWLGRNREGR
jgi:hypothetical protein